MPLGLAVFTYAADADQVADNSLETEVERYLTAASDSGSDGNTFKVYWKTGLNLKSANGWFSLKIGGRIMIDVTWFDVGDNFDDDDFMDGNEFRRVRMFMSGHIYEHVKYKLQLDFADAEVEFKDVYIELVKLPVVKNLRMGHYKEPFGLMELTSSKYIYAIERSPASEATAPGRNFGWMVHMGFREKRGYFAIGLFRDTGDDGEKMGDGNYNITLRITYLIVDNKEDDLRVHLGFSFSFRDPMDDEAGIEVGVRPSAHKAAEVVGGDLPGVDDFLLVGFEVAVAYGSWDFQLEFFLTDVNRTSGFDDDPSFFHFYVQIGYWLTGEMRAYKKGAHGRTKPKQNWVEGEGHGAWQLVFRYSMVDFNDGSVMGGELDDFVFGVNWHLNPNTRIMWNFVFFDVTNGGLADEDGFAFIMRWQVDF